MEIHGYNWTKLMMGNHRVIMVLHAKFSGDVRQSTKDALQVDNLAKKMSLGIKKVHFS
jgi:hypothetical protein